jgi:DNA-binding MarR family transcriptional regulator
MTRLPHSRTALVEALNALIPAGQRATNAVDDAAAERLGINRTDLRCLGVILTEGGMSASALAECVGLTRGSMTIALDRLEAAGYLRRLADPEDRRGVRVEATAAARRAVRDIWEPIREDGSRMIRRYSDAELELLRRFLEEYSGLQRTHAERIRRTKARKRT